MARRYLGYGTTNAQGVATLDHDPEGNPLTHSYTGVGAGKLDIIAESGNLQSEIFELTDCTFYDMGTDPDNPSTNYYASGFQKVVEETGTSANYTGSGSNGHFYIGQTSSASRPQSTGTCLELDIVTCTSVRMVSIGDGTGYLSYDLNNTTGTFKVVIDDTNTTMYLDGTQVATKANSEIGSTFAFRFTTNTTGATIKFKNLKIYPI